MKITKGKGFVVTESNDVKRFRSDEYNFVFDKLNGNFARWGKTHQDDPQYSPFGNEILDCEISTICKQGCAFCYKANTPNGKNMSFETFKKLLDKILATNKCLGQVAFGSGSTGEENPDTWKIMEYCREKGIVPNITVANISDETADRLVKYCGAVAISRYSNKNMCYDSVKKLTDRGLKQCNIHNMICSENYDQAIETIEDIKTDPRLSKLNAIVFLSLKQKGRGQTGFTSLDQTRFNKMVDKCFEYKIGFGCDSCGAVRFIKSIENRPDKEEITQMVEPCESQSFSYYTNVNGEGFPCSFTEGTVGWESGLDIINCNDFIKDVWNHPRAIAFRNKLLACNRNCPIYNI